MDQAKWFATKKEEIDWDKSGMGEWIRQTLMGYADCFYELERSLSAEGTTLLEDRRERFEERRLWENRQLIGSSLGNLAERMKTIAGEMLTYRPMEKKKSAWLIRMLRVEGINMENPEYIPFGGQKWALSMTLSTKKKSGILGEEVADLLSVLLKKQMKVSKTCPLQVDHICRNFLFMEETKFVALTGYARVVKEKERVCGDNYSIMESEQGRITLLLSDGTGSGEKACKDSTRVLDLMDKLLETGYDMESAVNLVNLTTFVTGEEPNYPTLDSCEVDLQEGACEIYKIGGAASFIKRKSAVEKLERQSLPLGVFQKPQVEKIKRRLESGDSVFLLSDGVLEAFSGDEGEGTIVHIIESLGEYSPREMAERLLQTALVKNGGYVGDDMTILVVTIWERGCMGEKKEP